MRNPRCDIQDQKPSHCRQLWRTVVRLGVSGAQLVAVAGVSGCSEEGSERVIVFAASSMSGALAEVESAFEEQHPGVDMECVYAGSQTLAMQINEGAPADVFVSADLDQMERVEGFGSPAVLVENRLVAIGSLGSTGATVAEMVDQADRIVIAQVDVPAGRYTRVVLEELGVWDTVEPKVVSYEHSVRGVLGKITLEQADLGFVYQTDALSEADSVRTIEFPSNISMTTRTWIAHRDESQDAEIVYRFITEAVESRRIFAEHGFLVEEGSP